MIMSRETAQAVVKELGLEITSEFVPWSKSRNAKEKQPSLNWMVSLRHPKMAAPIIITDYMAGHGHCPSYKKIKNHLRLTKDEDTLLRWECENGKTARELPALGHVLGKQPILPDPLDVIYSLLSDGNAIDNDFENWAADLGYDTDSRRAEKIYNQCIEIGLALRRALGDENLKKLQEAFQDY